MPNTVTPNISLLEPALGDSGWNVPLNTNFTTIDSCFGGTVPIPAEAITGALTEGSSGVVGWSSNANPTLAVADTGLSRTAAKTVAVGNGVQGDATGTLRTAIAQIGGTDTGLSRTAAATVAIGNGGQGNASGVLLVGDGSSGAPSYAFGSSPTSGIWWDAGNTRIGFAVAGANFFDVSSVMATIRNGVLRAVEQGAPGGVALSDILYADSTAHRLKMNNNNTGASLIVGVDATTLQKTESALDTNVLTFTPPAVAGTYRISFVLSLSAANAAVVGWTATWTDSNGTAKSPTNLALFQVGAAAPTLTFTTSTTDDFYGTAVIDVNSGAANIVIKFTLGSGTITAKATATIERIA